MLRELMYDSRRFDEIARGVPRMSRGLLTVRLHQLERAGIVRHAGAAPGKEGISPRIPVLGKAPAALP